VLVVAPNPDLWSEASLTVALTIQVRSRLTVDSTLK